MSSVFCSLSLFYFKPFFLFALAFSPISPSLSSNKGPFFAHHVLFSVEALSWVIGVCWNFFSPHPFYCSIDGNDKVQVQPRRVLEPARDGLWCTRTGERSSSSCALQLQSGAVEETPIGSGHLYTYISFSHLHRAAAEWGSHQLVSLRWWRTQERISNWARFA